MTREEIEHAIVQEFGPGYYMVHDVAEKTGISAYSIKRWIRDGLLTNISRLEIGDSSKESKESFAYVFSDEDVRTIREISQLSARGRREKGIV